MAAVALLGGKAWCCDMKGSTVCTALGQVLQGQCTVLLPPN